jgi:hypothetical protein
VYALSVVLFTMLLASGAGSLASGWFEPRRGRPRARVGVVASLLVYALALPPLLAAARGLPIPVRVAIAVGSIAPLAWLMGIPFASGLRRAGGESKALVPWAWAVNGGASVLGSTLTILVSMTYGFTTSFVGGALAYGVALVAVHSLERRR